MRGRHRSATIHQQPAGTLREPGRPQHHRGLQQGCHAGKRHLLQRELPGGSRGGAAALRRAAGGKILHGAERRYHLVHCPEKRPDREGTVRNEHRLYRQRRKRPDPELQDPARRCTDRGAGGGNAGGAHHQGGKLGGRDRLHHRDHQVQRAELRYQARYPEG